MEVLQGKFSVLAGTRRVSWMVPWAALLPLESLSPSHMGSRFSQHAKSGFTEIMQLRVI